MAYDQTLFNPSNKNFLSPVGFKFVIGRTPNVDYFCQSASIPEVNIGVREVPTPVKDYSVPGDKMTFGDLNLRFLVNEDLDNYYEIFKWLKGLTNPKHQKDFFAYINSVDEKGRPEPFERQMIDCVTGMPMTTQTYNQNHIDHTSKNPFTENT